MSAQPSERHRAEDARTHSADTVRGDAQRRGGDDVSPTWGRTGANVGPAGGDVPLLATVDETAALLRTTRKAIYVMVERGQLPGVVRIGRRVLIRTPELLDWLRQKSTPSLER